MKLIPKQTRVNTTDSLGHGMDAVVTLVVFMAIGFGIDRLAGTLPVFVVVFTLIGAVGLFLKFKYRYEDRMNELEAERRARMGGAKRVDVSAPTTPNGPDTPDAAGPAARKIA